MNQEGSPAISGTDSEAPEGTASTEQPRAAQPSGTDAQPDSRQPPNANGKAAQGTKASLDRREVDRLTSAQNLRQTSSEARDAAAVLSPFANSFQPGMGVGRDVRVEGDLVVQMGQLPAMGGGRPQTRAERATAVDRSEVNRVAAVYQHPVAYGRCLDRLERRHLTMLLGPAHAGKRAMAIHLALDLTGDGAILEYGSQVNLDDSSLDWRPCISYLVDGLQADRARALQRQVLQDIANDLERVGSYLILCLNPDAQPHDDVEREFGVRVGPPEQGAAVLLESHIKFYAQPEFSLAEIQDLLGRPELVPVLRQALSPRSVDDLSQRLLGVLRGEDLSAALKDLATDVQDEVDAWFEESGDDVEERAFRIALAAFNGARFAAVQGAAVELAERLAPPLLPEADKAPRPVPSHFARRVSRRLERARAHLESAPEPGSSLPGSRVEVVRLDNERYAPVLLRHVWREFDSLRDELLEWLAGHAVSRAADMRARAAAAIGAMAVYDLPTIREQVLIPWVKQDDRLHRAAIGRALGVAVWSDETAPDVLALLKKWSGEGAARDFRWAAARAYADIGLRYPREAMGGWRCILTSAEREARLGLGEDWWLVLSYPLVMSILDTMVNFFLAAVEWPERYRPVYEGALEELRSWCDRDREERRQDAGLALGLPLFMVLADVCVPDPTSRAEEDLGPPAMLVLVSAGAEPSPYRETLADLWRRVLNWRPAEQEALTSLRNWLRRVDHDRRLEERAIALLREIATGTGATGRDRDRLAVHLARWAGDPHKPVESAGAARRALRW